MQCNDLRLRPLDECRIHDVQLTQLVVVRQALVTLTEREIAAATLECPMSTR